MIGVLIIPTGIGCQIGGHAGDANPVAKLIAGCCDTLITHPNVLNASDINEMTENTLYVEGSMLDRFLEGEIRLKRTKTQNKILVAVNKPARGDSINAVSAARATIGIDAEIIELDTPLQMVAKTHKGRACGDITGHFQLMKQLEGMEFDALAIHTQIDVPKDVALDYYRNGGVNPWGGVEAILSRCVSFHLKKPVAHAPLESVTVADGELFNVGMEPVDPRIAPEAISFCYLHCVLKGLNKAPTIAKARRGITVEDVDFMVTPAGCWGPPHKACKEKGIPIIAVAENMPSISVPTIQHKVPIVDNYLEAAGVIMSMKAGIKPESVRRPIHPTRVIKSSLDD